MTDKTIFIFYFNVCFHTAMTSKPLSKCNKKLSKKEHQRSAE